MGWHWWLWAAALLVVVALFAGFIKILSSSPEKETPRQILDKRYARGEISQREYQRMKKDLSH